MRENELNAMTLDVEDWHNATVLQCSGLITAPTEAVRINSERMLGLLEECGVRATWFFLGEVAEAFPGLVRRIVEAGHEPGVHGYHHHQIRDLDPRAYRESVFRAKETVEQAGGAEVRGYRAVDYSINQETWYALDVLVEAGFKYDSSIFPFRGPRYGMSDATLGPHWIEPDNGGQLYEIPVSVANILGVRIPCGGGGYFRHLPLFLTKILLHSIQREGRPIVFYLHPCEIEFPSAMKPLPGDLNPEQIAEIRKCHKSQVRNRRYMEKKLRHLFREFSFDTMWNVFAIENLDPVI
jgi:polysaccharide deacetylase family protein (PEP-CTERM system associated)